MHEALRSIRQTPSSALSVRDSRRQGREQQAPFRLEDPPPGETEEARESETADRAPLERLDLGHRLDDEEGQKLDVTA